MKKFPCQNCLVKTCCSEYCDDLIKEPHSINLHITTLNQCPDCGSYEMAGRKTSDLRICFQCSKVFQKESIVKPGMQNTILTNVKPPMLKITATQIPTIIAPMGKHEMIIGDPNIITDISNLDPPKITPVTMEETHDVVYTRLTVFNSRYVLRSIDDKTRNSITRVTRKKTPPIKHPSWSSQYESIFPPDDEDCSEPQLYILTPSEAAMI